MKTESANDPLLEMVTFRVAGHCFAVESKQVLSLLSSTQKETGAEACISLAQWLPLPAAPAPLAGTTRWLLVRCRDRALRVLAEDPILLNLFPTAAFHPLPELMRCRLRHPAVQGVIVTESGWFTILDTDELSSGEQPAPLAPSLE